MKPASIEESRSRSCAVACHGTSLGAHRLLPRHLWPLAVDPHLLLLLCGIPRACASTMHYSTRRSDLAPTSKLALREPGQTARPPPPCSGDGGVPRGILHPFHNLSAPRAAPVASWLPECHLPKLRRVIRNCAVLMCRNSSAIQCLVPEHHATHGNKQHGNMQRLKLVLPRAMIPLSISLRVRRLPICSWRCGRG